MLNNRIFLGGLTRSVRICQQVVGQKITLHSDRTFAIGLRSAVMLELTQSSVTAAVAYVS